MQKESLSLYLYEKLNALYKFWTDPKYGDNPDTEILIKTLKENLLEETTIAWENFAEETIRGFIDKVNNEKI